MDLRLIQAYLQEQGVDGWLLYNFRDLNPIAISVAGLPSGGSRRWFLWIPAHGAPRWLIHAIEGNMFVDARPELAGEKLRYVSWQEMAQSLPRLIGAESGQGANHKPKILMEYSPGNAIPFISRIDAGIMEVVKESTGAEILSSADAAQLALAVLTPEQVASHRRAAAICLDAKEAAFDLIAQRLRSGQTIMEHEAQQFVVDYFAQAGLEPLAPIVSVNGNAADPHYFPSAARPVPIRAGDVVLIDLWSRERNSPDDSMADLTWTAYCGREVPAKVQQVFETVIAGRDRAVAYIEERLAAGAAVHGYEVDDACRQVIADAGYGPYFIHRTGHSLGPTGHYLGVNIDNLETQDKRSLVPGVMFTIEPGIYMPDFNFDDSPAPKGLGIRSEINCFMHEGRVEVTTLPLQTAMRALLA